ncbi:MAG: LuxR C-terminal-related transcriptional regulator [Planctomycetota bacterium]
MSTLSAAGESRLTADRALAALAQAAGEAMSRQDRMDRLARGLCGALHADWAVWSLLDDEGGAVASGSASGESSPPHVALPAARPPSDWAPTPDGPGGAVATTWRETPTDADAPPAQSDHGPGAAVGCLVAVDGSTSAWLACYRDRRRPGFSHHDAEILGRSHAVAAALLRSEPGGRSDDPRVQKLPTRLRQTLAGLLGGQSEKQVAAELGLSPHTVHNYVRQLYRRFEVSSRGELLSLFVTRPAPRPDVHLGEGI